MKFSKSFLSEPKIFWLVILLFLSLAIWAANFEIDKSVIVQGDVKPQGMPILLQNRFEGEVSEIHIRTGEQVTKNQKTQPNEIPKIEIKQENINKIELSQTLTNQITPIIQRTDINKLLKEDEVALKKSQEEQINIFSNLIIQTIQSAWIKPNNIQDGLVCELRIFVNQNGRVLKADLIKSSGNIRFDNSALMAIDRLETFNFYNQIPNNLFNKEFKNILITFNPK